MPNQERNFKSCGKNHAIRFTHDALYRLEQKLGRPLAALQASLEPAELRVLLWAGLDGARRKAGLPAEPATVEQAAAIIDELGADAVVSLAFGALRDAFPKGAAASEPEQLGAAERASRDWESLLADAMELGLKPDEFWNLTPGEFALYAAAQARRVQSDLRRTMALAWNIAALVRTANLPPLNQLLDPAQPEAASEDELARGRRDFQELSAAMLRNGKHNG